MSQESDREIIEILEQQSEIFAIVSSFSYLFHMRLSSLLYHGWSTCDAQIVRLDKGEARFYHVFQFPVL